MKSFETHNADIMVNTVSDSLKKRQDCLICHDDRFRRNLGQVQVALYDADGTLYPGSMHNSLRELMSGDMQEAGKKLASLYFNSTTTPLSRMQFLHGGFDRLRQSAISRNDFRNVATRLERREGLYELMKSFGRKNYIASYGYGDLIEDWAKVNELEQLISHIYALRFRWDENGQLIGRVLGTSTTEDNKGMVAIELISHLGIKPQQLLVLGDSPVTDLGMLKEGMGVLIVSHAEKDVMRRTQLLRELASAWSHIDAILVSDSLMSLVEMRR